MKVEIQYIRSADIDAPIAAKCEVMGELFVGVGVTPEEAKQRVIAKVTTFLNANLPPPETVEIPYGAEEMEMPELLPTSFLEQVVFGGGKVKDEVTK